MENNIAGKILEKIGDRDLIKKLTNTLSSSELNSLLMEVFRVKTEKISPAELMNLYELNRFVKPAEEDPIKMLELQLEIFKTAGEFSFEPIGLSPVAQLGSCSRVATVDQNKIISALRGTEVLADATNSIALHICSLKRKNKKDKAKDDNSVMKFCALQRLVRAQMVDIPGFLPHFSLYCMVTAGRDMGSHSFEKENLLEHLNFYKKLLKDSAGRDDLKIKIFKINTNENSSSNFDHMVNYIRENFDSKIEALEDESRSENLYYRDLQFKIYLDNAGEDFEIADGGFVDWSQRLLGNKKERMMISGLGVSRLLYLKEGFV